MPRENKWYTNLVRSLFGDRELLKRQAQLQKKQELNQERNCNILEAKKQRIERLVLRKHELMKELCQLECKIVFLETEFDQVLFLAQEQFNQMKA